MPTDFRGFARYADRVRVDSLRIVQAIAQNGSLRKAAAQLGMSQPSVTHALRQLESQLGAQLVYRTAGGSGLTEIGQAALPYIEDIVLTSSRLVDEIQALLNLDKGHLHVGASGMATTAMLVPVLRQLAAENPGLDIAVTEAGSVEIVDLVTTGELEIGLVRRADVLSPLAAAVVVEDLTETRLVVCVPNGHEWLAHRSSIALSDLAGQPLIVPRRGYLFSEITRRCLGDEELNVVCRTEHPAAARALVAQGFGVTVATEEEAMRDRADGLFQAIPVQEDQARVWTSIVQKRSPYTATVAKRFLQIFKDHVGRGSA